VSLAADFCLEILHIKQSFVRISIVLQIV